MGANIHRTHCYSGPPVQPLAYRQLLLKGESRSVVCLLAESEINSPTGQPWRTNGGRSEPTDL